MRALRCIVLFALCLLCSSCDLLFNGKGGNPAYYQYVKDSVNLSKLGVSLPSSDSPLYLQVVRAEDELTSQLLGANSSLVTEALVLGYESASLRPIRGLIFDFDLGLLYDTSNSDGLFGSYSSFIYLPSEWNYRVSENGAFDLGEASFQLSNDGASVSTYADELRTSEHYQWITMYDSAAVKYKDYLVSLEVLDSSHSHVTADDELRLVTHLSSDSSGTILPADGLYEDGDDPVTTHLLTDPDNVVNSELDRQGMSEYSGDGSFEFALIGAYPDRAEDRLMLQVGAYQGEQQLLTFLFFLPYGDLADTSIYPSAITDQLPDFSSDYLSSTVENSYEYLCLATDFIADVEVLHMNFDGEYFALFTGSGWNGEGEPWQNSQLKVYRISGSGYSPVSASSPELELLSSVDYSYLFGDGELGYDFDLAMGEGEGLWFLFDRTGSVVYRLNLGAGGW